MAFNKKKLVIFISILLTIVLVLFLCLMFNQKINIEKAKESVMLIYSYNEDGEMMASGSGFIAFEDDILITNAHVIEDASRIEVISEKNNKYNVLGIIGYDLKKDIAIFKIENYKNLKRFSISKKIEIGDDVYAIGSPLGIKNTVSNGILSGIREEDGFNIYQYTAPISPGSSGGALLNKKGEVVGITYASIIDGQNLNLAIQISDVENLYNKQKKQYPLQIAYKNLLESKLIFTDNIKNMIIKFNKLVNKEQDIFYLKPKKNDSLRLTTVIRATNGKLWGFNELEGVTDSGGACNYIGTEWYNPNLELGKCFMSQVNPKWKSIDVQIYEKTSKDLKDFENEIKNASLLANFYIHTSHKSEKGYYEDDNYYYYVQYANISTSDIDFLFQNK